MGKPESGVSMVLVIVSGRENRETQSHAGAGAVRCTAGHGGHWQAWQTPAGATMCTWAGRAHVAMEGHGRGGTKKEKPLRATGWEEGKREGRPHLHVNNTNSTPHTIGVCVCVWCAATCRGVGCFLRKGAETKKKARYVEIPCQHNGVRRAGTLSLEPYV